MSLKEAHNNFNNTNNIKQVDIQYQMQKAYLSYAMAVIIGRAIPDVRDGLKPVHRRVIYAMYRGGYLPNKSFNKCSRVVGEVMGLYHPHGDIAIYDALVRLIQEWSMRYPLAQGQGNFGSPGNDSAAAPRYTETRMSNLSLEMISEIDEGTVDFHENYDGKNLEPNILPARLPNLIINGSSGIAVGMATNIPPHNLKEVVQGVQWYLNNLHLSKEEIYRQLRNFIKGPDFPTKGEVLDIQGIEKMYKTGKGSFIMRAVIKSEEIHNKKCLIATELPYQVNPDYLAMKIAELIKNGKLLGISDLRDESSGRTGQRLVIVLKKGAISQVVINNLYKYTQLQETYNANMLAIVNGAPELLTLDRFISYWVKYRIEVTKRRIRNRLEKTREIVHILCGYIKTLNNLNKVISLVKYADNTEQASNSLVNFLTIDKIQAKAILSMQLRNLANMERQKIEKKFKKLENKIIKYEEILTSQSLQISIIHTELEDIIKKYGDSRKTKIILTKNLFVKEEELIPKEKIVVTLTKKGYIKRTNSTKYRLQHKGGKGSKGVRLRRNDVVKHCFVTTTHNWLLFFTNLGRVYKKKAYEITESERESRGQHLVNILSLKKNEKIAQVLAIASHEQSSFLVLFTKLGMIKKTNLSDYKSIRKNGIIGIRLKQGDELVSAKLANTDSEIILISKNGQSLCFCANDQSLRPMKRSTMGVIGMKFKNNDQLLTADIVEKNSFLFIATKYGYAKRTYINKYRKQKRGGIGVKVARLTKKRGDLIGATIVQEKDEILFIMKSGKIMRALISEIAFKGRNTMGMIFVKTNERDSVLNIVRNVHKLNS